MKRAREGCGNKFRHKQFLKDERLHWLYLVRWYCEGGRRGRLFLPQSASNAWKRSPRLNTAATIVFLRVRVSCTLNSNNKVALDFVAVGHTQAARPPQKTYTASKYFGDVFVLSPTFFGLMENDSVEQTQKPPKTLLRLQSCEMVLMYCRNQHLFTRSRNAEPEL